MRRIEIFDKFQMNATYDVFRTKPHADRLPLGHNFKLLTDIDSVELQPVVDLYGARSATLQIKPKKGELVQLKIADSPEQVRARIAMIKLVETLETRAEKIRRSRKFSKDLRDALAKAIRDDAQQTRGILRAFGIELPE